MSHSLQFCGGGSLGYWGVAPCLSCEELFIAVGVAGVMAPSCWLCQSCGCRGHPFHCLDPHPCHLYYIIVSSSSSPILCATSSLQLPSVLPAELSVCSEEVSCYVPYSPLLSILYLPSVPWKLRPTPSSSVIEIIPCHLNELPSTLLHSQYRHCRSLACPSTVHVMTSLLQIIFYSWYLVPHAYVELVK